MNFLAHLRLSTSTETRIGNFIGDHVKGRQYEQFPEAIRLGILLHRKIDMFTDRHPLVKAGSVRFRTVFGKYSVVIIDMVYDYLLASNWDKLYDTSLSDFSQMCYNELDSNFDLLPDSVQFFLPKMIASRRLESYATTAGLLESLDRMAKYTSLPNYGVQAVEIINQNSKLFEAEFFEFWPIISTFVQEEFHRLKFAS